MSVHKHASQDTYYQWPFEHDFAQGFQRTL
jgi:hypothetical protein